MHRILKKIPSYSLQVVRFECNDKKIIVFKSEKNNT